MEKRLSPLEQLTHLRYYAHKFPKLRLTEPTVRRLKDEDNDFMKNLPQDKRKELKELPRKKKQSRPLLLGHEYARVQSVCMNFFEALKHCKRLSTLNLSMLENYKFVKFSFRQNFLSYSTSIQIIAHILSILL